MDLGSSTFGGTNLPTARFVDTDGATYDVTSTVALVGGNQFDATFNNASSNRLILRGEDSGNNLKLTVTTATQEIASGKTWRSVTVNTDIYVKRDGTTTSSPGLQLPLQIVKNIPALAAVSSVEYRLGSGVVLALDHDDGSPDTRFLTIGSGVDANSSNNSNNSWSLVSSTPDFVNSQAAGVFNLDAGSYNFTLSLGIKLADSNSRAWGHLKAYIEVDSVSDFTNAPATIAVTQEYKLWPEAFGDLSVLRLPDGNPADQSWGGNSSSVWSLDTFPTHVAGSAFYLRVRLTAVEESYGTPSSDLNLETNATWVSDYIGYLTITKV